MRASTSAAMRNVPPRRKAAGNRRRWPEPTIDLAPCGTMRPTNPMRPETATTEPASSEAVRYTAVFTLSTGSPLWKAASSPRSSRSIPRERRNRTATPAAT